jgi:peptidoglycan hydrolase-like protein with peptidoglycan-binding domain
LITTKRFQKETTMRKFSIYGFATIAAVFFNIASFAQSSDLILQIEQHLAALGYDTGPVDGTETLETTISISKFQSENSLEVTGVATPELSGTMANIRLSGGAATTAAVAAPAPAAAPSGADLASLQAAQQSCLQEKIAAQQASQQRNRGFRGLASAVSRVASRVGVDLSDLTQVTQDIYTTNATAADLSQAAKDLGLSDSEVEECRNPN